MPAAISRTRWGSSIAHTYPAAKGLLIYTYKVADGHNLLLSANTY
jgi:hypothetical protein